MKQILPPPVSPSDEEPIATGGRRPVDGLTTPDKQPVRRDEGKISFFTAARDAIGSEEPIAMGGW